MRAAAAKIVEYKNVANQPMKVSSVQGKLFRVSVIQTIEQYN